MATEHVGVAVSDGTQAALVHLVVASAPGAEGGGVMEDVGHAEEGTTVQDRDAPRQQLRC